MTTLKLKPNGKRKRKRKSDPMVVGRGTKEFHDFFTPPEVATKMAEHLRPSLREHALTGKVATVLEPSAGV